MPSTFVPAQRVAPARTHLRVPFSRRLRELAMLIALVAPTALAQQAAPSPYAVDMSETTSGTGELAADKFAIAGTVENFSGSASGGSFSLSSGMSGPPSGAVPGDVIFLNSFD